MKRIQQSGAMAGCIEEAAFKAGFISRAQVHALDREPAMTKYGQRLTEL